MKTLCKAAGVRYFRFHALRHSGASLIASDGRASIRSIQKILGHENLSTTEKYLHSLSDAERLAMEIFEEKSEEKSEGKSEGKGEERVRKKVREISGKSLIKSLIKLLRDF